MLPISPQISYTRNETSKLKSGSFFSLAQFFSLWLLSAFAYAHVTVAFLNFLSDP